MTLSDSNRAIRAAVVSFLAFGVFNTAASRAKAQNLRMGKLFWAGVVILCLTGVAPAAALYESATIGTNTGFLINNSQYFGVRFTVSTAVIANEIGGEIRGQNLSLNPLDFGTTGNNQLFGAIIQLTSASDFPDSINPINSSDVLATTLITAAGSYTDTSAAIGPVALLPGIDYALLFGSGQFGATGRGVGFGGSNIGTPSYYGGSHGSSVYFNAGTAPVRLFVNGIVPEPASLVLLALGGMAMLSRRRRR